MFTVQVSMPKWFKFWPFISVLLVIFWLSVIKAPSIKFSEHWFWDNIDKFGHAFVYAVLTYSGVFSYGSFSKRKQISKQKIFAFMLLSFLYGLSIEFLQHFLPYRSFDPLDILANAFGTVCGAVISVRLFS